MAKIINLTVHINTREKRQRRMIGRRLREFAKKMSCDDMDGFAIVAFRYGKDNRFSYWSSCSCRNAVDRTRPPDIAKSALLEKIILPDDPPKPPKEGA